MNKATHKRPKNSSVDHSESFDEFLARDGLLAETEDAAIKEIIADQIELAMEKRPEQNRHGRAHED